MSKYLQHVAENAENTMKSLIILSGGTCRSMGLPADAGHKLRHEAQVNDERTGQERVFTNV